MLWVVRLERNQLFKWQLTFKLQIVLDELRFLFVLKRYSQIAFQIVQLLPQFVQLHLEVLHQKAVEQLVEREYPEVNRSLLSQLLVELYFAHLSVVHAAHQIQGGRDNGSLVKFVKLRINQDDVDNLKNLSKPELRLKLMSLPL